MSKMSSKLKVAFLTNNKLQTVFAVRFFVNAAHADLVIRIFIVIQKVKMSLN